MSRKRCALQPTKNKKKGLGQQKPEKNNGEFIHHHPVMVSQSPHLYLQNVAAVPAPALVTIPFLSPFYSPKVVSKLPWHFQPHME